jgi:hypothetical protein
MERKALLDGALGVSGDDLETAVWYDQIFKLGEQ